MATTEWLQAGGYKVMAIPQLVSDRQLREGPLGSTVEKNRLRYVIPAARRSGRRVTRFTRLLPNLRQHKYRCEQVDPMVHELEETLL